ncbi:MAG: hypothetical protein Q8N26_13135 [Myxococcales bacterium]|nr:hypothetical protein [Myxococcales bacterium]
MSPLALLTVPMLLGAGAGLKLEAVRSDVDEWPSPRLAQETADALERTSRQKWSEHYLVVGDEQRGDVLVRGVFGPSKEGAGFRFTWQLTTQDCPPMSDAVGFDFKSSALTPNSLDSMAVQLAKRAARLLDKARSKRGESCIDPTDLPPTPSELELMKIREAARAQREFAPGPRPPPPAPPRMTPVERPPPRPRPIPVRSEAAN